MEWGGVGEEDAAKDTTFLPPCVHGRRAAFQEGREREKKKVSRSFCPFSFFPSVVDTITLRTIKKKRRGNFGASPSLSLSVCRQETLRQSQREEKTRSPISCPQKPSALANEKRKRPIRFHSGQQQHWLSAADDAPQGGRRKKERAEMLLWPYFCFKRNNKKKLNPAGYYLSF